MIKRTKSLRVPSEFEQFITDISVKYSNETGLPVNKSATMRRMAKRLKSKLVVRGNDFDWRII